MTEPSLDGLLTALGILESYLFLDDEKELTDAYAVLVPRLGPENAVDVIGGMLAIMKGFFSRLDPADVHAFIDECRRSALEDGA